MSAHVKLFVHAGPKTWRSPARTKVAIIQRCFEYTRTSADSDTATLPDGRTVGFARYGASDGPKVFYLHGSPGSRLEGKIFESPASKLGIDLIALDRPGIGLSSPQINRSVSDHARDVKDLATLLRCKEYCVMGISAGGPYALACALTHAPAKLRGVAVVAGIQHPDFSLQGMPLMGRLIYRSFQYAPHLLRLITKPIVNSQLKRSDEELLEYFLKKLPKSKLPEMDRQVFSDPNVIRLFIASAREHFRQGFDAWLQDCQLLGLDWGFRIEDIMFSQLKLWYGTADLNIAPRTGPELKKILGERAVLHMKDEGHLSLEFNCGEQILVDLLEGR